jgi:DNA-binding CsgD family transcriptional regulator
MLWTEGRRRHVLDAAGNVVAFETISRDITERVEAEDRARAAERMEQLIVSAIPDSVLQVARTGTITAVLHGDVTPSPFAVQPRDGALLADLLPAEAAPAVMRQLGIALVSKQVEVARFEISGRETDLVFEVRIAPVDSEQAIAFFRNVTGDAYLKRAVERDRTKEELEGKAERRILRANPYALTFREFTVLELVARGLTDKQIAQELGISLNTVGKHVSNILGKMEVSSRTEASVRAVQAHLLD